jgi:hypothetical protein
MKTLFFCLSFIFAFQNMRGFAEQCFSPEHRNRILKEARSHHEKRKLLKQKIERILGSAMHSLGDYVVNPDKAKAAHTVLTTVEAAIRKELECSNVHDVVFRIAKKSGYKTVDAAIHAITEQLDTYISDAINNYNTLYWAGAWYISLLNDDLCLSAGHIKKLCTEAQKDPKKYARLKSKLEKITAMTLHYLGDYLIHERRRENIAFTALSRVECAVEDELHCRRANEVTAALLKKFDFKDIAHVLEFATKQLGKSIDHVIHEGFNLGKFE